MSQKAEQLSLPWKRPGAIEEGGIIVLVIYTGHSGGREELDAILEFTSALKADEYNVLRYHFINQENSPELIAVIKR